MTRLASVTNNHVALECACGHRPIVLVTKFTEKYGLEANVNNVIAKAPSSVCNSKNIKENRIVFVGNSGFALELRIIAKRTLLDDKKEANLKKS